MEFMIKLDAIGTEDQQTLYRLLKAKFEPSAVSRLDCLDAEIDDISEWSRKVFYLLKAHRINTIGDLVKWTGEDLLRLPSFGRKSLSYVEQYLREKGLALRCN